VWPGPPAGTGDMRTVLPLCPAGDIMTAQPGRTTLADGSRAL
jgi:hypothetical protein